MESHRSRRLGVLCGHVARNSNDQLAPVPVATAGGRLEGQALPSTWRTKTNTGSPVWYTPVLKSEADPSSDTFKKRQAHNKALCDELQRRTHITKLGAGGKAEELQRKRGKNLARERVHKIIDEGTEFMELSTLAAYELFGGGWHSGGLVTGVGVVAGRECVFICNDPTIKGGTFANPAGGKKMARAQEIAMINHLPLIWLVDGGGAKLDQQAGPPPNPNAPAKKKDPNAPPPRDTSYEGALPAAFVMGGRAFYNQMRMSSQGIPQFAITCGGATAGSAYFVALTEENIIVDGNGSVYLGGPPLVKAATGEDADNESLGGGLMHTSTSGTVDHYAPTEDDALTICRRSIENLGRHVPRLVLPNLAVPEPPLYDAESILGVIPESSDTPYDIREVIMRIVDGSRFHEFKARYGTSLVCGYAHVEGYPVGILGNNGLICERGAIKAAHFVQMCGQRLIPLVFLHNTQGFVMGKEVEEHGIVKHCANMISAVSNVRVPKISIICGDSFGPGNFAMCGVAFGPRFIFSWPTAKVANMSSSQLANVKVEEKQEDLLDDGKPLLNPAEVADMKKAISDKFESGISAWKATAWVCDDGMIDPRDTRKALANAISISLNAPLPPESYGAFRI